MTLQRRISFALGALVTLFVVAQGTLAFLSLEEQEDALVDEIVLSETKRLVSRIEGGELSLRPGVTEIELGTNLSAWLLPRNVSDRASLPARLRSLAAGPHMIEEAVQTYHIVVAPIAAGTLFVQYDATLNEERVYRFGLELLITGAICIALGAVLAHMLARLVVAPLHRLAERFARTAPGSTLAEESRSDEEAMLLMSFDRVRSGLETAAARQREFASNIAHELRTPLTAARTDIELAALSPHLSADELTRLQRAMQTIDAAASALDSLYATSSQQAGSLGPVDLHAIVDDAWNSLANVNGQSRLQFVNAIPPGETVVGDRHALLTILRNLLRNAMEHAGPARCTVRRTADGLQVSDDGPGIAGTDLPFVFERYYRGRLSDAPGDAVSERGLGLAIAKQSAEVNGWRLSVESQPNAGTCFSLSLASQTSI